ncbi:Ribonucleotide reductase of class III (anaerobic), large subunit, partial [hydrothermal vent metagenome]
EHHRCLKCEEECEVYSRVVGYLRPVKQWNKGKKQEFINRKTYCINHENRRISKVLTH